MTQPFPCTRLEHEFNRMFQRVPKPETPVSMDKETTEERSANYGRTNCRNSLAVQPVDPVTDHSLL